MRRREVYATTGPRITLRFFGGWDYASDDAPSPNFAEIGYRKGVPMGGDLVLPSEGAAPSFLLRAVKDPDGANLDRVQVVKGWRDAKGELHEKVHDVAWSGDRARTDDGKLPAVGSTVDVKAASYLNSIGSPSLVTTWTDPDFDPDEAAFYYVRVIQIPTPRWTTYDAKFYGLEEIQQTPPAVIRERAYSSPIWYTPQGHERRFATVGLTTRALRVRRAGPCLPDSRRLPRSCRPMHSRHPVRLSFVPRFPVPAP